MQEFNQDEYLDMLNLEDKYTKSPTIWEVSKSFPDCRDIAIRVAHRYSFELSKYNQLVSSDRDFAIIIQFDLRSKIISQIKRYLEMTKDVVNKKELNVESARRFPIQDLYDFENRKEFRSRIQCSCPFHKDKTPSMIIYKDSNTYHCFSCQSGGDAISFTMNLNGLKFVDAVNFLNGWDNE